MKKPRGPGDSAGSALCNRELKLPLGKLAASLVDA